MFRTLARSVTSLARGPRAILSSLIARSLSEYFLLDDDQERIESTLSSSEDEDARIVLQNAQLREKKFLSEINKDVAITVNGIVEEVKFSWKWALNGNVRVAYNGRSRPESSSIIQNTELSVKGFILHIYFEQLSDLTDEEREALLSQVKKDDNGFAALSPSINIKKQGFLETYVQQIIDHLTLSVESFRFHIHVKNEPSTIMIVGKSISLGTLKSAKISTGIDTSTTLLNQILNISSLSAFLQRADAILIPIIEPFAYNISITRFAGTRFKGGILSGLEIIGLGEDSDADINSSLKLHINEDLLDVFCAVGLLYMHEEVVKNEQPETITCTDEENIVINSANPIIGDVGDQGNLYTIFRLHFPSITLFLTDQWSTVQKDKDESLSSISFPGITTIHYRTDGKIFRVFGKRGI
eukprot:CAMPEP_0116075762 /NCGR_PEP_ID=MMETSP0322-20121206/16827_1 /TAXON_ID=163516 /ORGANISM="Leptocylindrus danicus var. apora, Strain B651" /LENGTH=412 /DNA_ID=CAMNT_0003565881 /DNA_START=138 /DNA_END=1373 /DNA_ORIENTATION=+